MSDSLWDRILFRARLAPASLAVIKSRGVVTYQTLIEQTAGLATALLDHELTRNDSVGIHLPGSYLHLLLILALDRLGVPSSAIAVTVPPAQLPAIVARSGITLTVAADAAPDGITGRWLRMEEQDSPQIGQPNRARLQEIGRPADALVRILWSSGTTGGRKGACLTRACQMLRFSLYQTLFGYGPATRYLPAMDFSTSYGYGKPLAVLAAGGTLVLPFGTMDLAALARTTAVTTLGLNVAILDELLAAQGSALRGLESLRLEVTGGHLPRKLASDTRTFFTPNVLTVYGATECTTTAMADMAVAMAQPASVGFLVPSIEAEIVDAEDRVLAAGQEGRLRLRGRQIVAGYFNDERVTAEHFRAGWFYPGDVGSIAPDGLLRITGRLTELIKTGGVEIAPVPIESALAAQPGVRDAAVFAMTLAGKPQLGAALVLQPGADPAKILAAARESLGSYMPTHALLVESLPRSAGGKLLRGELAQLAEAAAGKQPSQGSGDIG